MPSRFLQVPKNYRSYHVVAFSDTGKPSQYYSNMNAQPLGAFPLSLALGRRPPSLPLFGIRINGNIQITCGVAYLWELKHVLPLGRISNKFALIISSDRRYPSTEDQWRQDFFSQLPTAPTTPRMPYRQWATKRQDSQPTQRKSSSRRSASNPGIPPAVLWNLGPLSNFHSASETFHLKEQGRYGHQGSADDWMKMVTRRSK